MDNGKIPMAIQETGWSEVASADLFIYVYSQIIIFFIIKVSSMDRGTSELNNKVCDFRINSD